jgi:hypothetical protein
MGARARVALAFIAVSAIFCLTGCGSIDDLKDTVYRSFDIGKVPGGRERLLPDGLPNATPMISPEKTLKENARASKKKDKRARKPRQPHTVELPKKPPISNEAVRPQGEARTGAPLPLRTPWPEAPAPGTFSR